MYTIHQQFIALQKAAHERAVELTSVPPVRGSTLRAAAYEVLSDAIAGLPLDHLAGEAALRHSEAPEVEDDPTLPICGLVQIDDGPEGEKRSRCILKVGHDGPHVMEES